MSKTITLIIIYFSLLFNASVFAANYQCNQETTTVKKLVTEAKSVFFGRALSFTKAKHPVHSGYYKFATSSQLKGANIGINKIWGSEPYKEISQYDIDTTLRHNTWTSELRGSASTGFAVHEGKCYLSPSFKLGWDYLIITGVQSPYSYELINSPSLDNWFKMVRAEAIKLLQ